MKTKLLTLIAAAVLLFSCERDTDYTSHEARAVRGAVVSVREIPDEATGFGSLSFISRVDITAPQEGVIRRLHFREGDAIAQGQIVVQLENPQINLAVERAENNFSQAIAARNLASSRLLEGRFQAEAQLLSLDKAAAELGLAKIRWEENRRRHSSQETLYEDGGIHTEAILVGRFTIDTEWEQIRIMERELDIRRIGRRDQDLVQAGIPVPEDEAERKEALVFLMTSSLRAELEAAHARVYATEKELASARIAFSELTIRSPAAGIVGARHLEEGERVRQQDNIISLIDTASLFALFPVRERDALRIERGMPASVLVDGTGETREGIVDLVYPQADSQSLSFLVRVLLEDDASFGLRPGMFVRVAVELGPPTSSVFIPESAIFNQRNNEGSVFSIAGTILRERSVTLGFAYGEEREITAGLNPGELIVLRPDPDLREGTSVTLVE